MSTRLFIANWKMEKSYSQSISFCTQNIDGLKRLSAHVDTELVLCPSFPALYSLNELLADTMVHIGAQNCSPYRQGAYTGDVSAQSLFDVGCNYCIIGHSEQRRYHHVSNEDVAHAAENLCDYGIEPIICIGESKTTYENNQTLSHIETQLEPILAAVKKCKQRVTIAYEPIWAIGSGITPDQNHLQKISTHIATLLSQASMNQSRIIYGGSVSPETISKFTQIDDLSGFLIGSASLDFQKFEKIVSLGA